MKKYTCEVPKKMWKKPENNWDVFGKSGETTCIFLLPFPAAVPPLQLLPAHRPDLVGRQDLQNCTAECMMVYNDDIMMIYDDNHHHLMNMSTSLQ